MRKTGGPPSGVRDAAAARLDALPESEARRALARCCGSGRWVEAMLQLRPFVTDAELLNAAERTWWALGEEEWREAFRHHPRIGEREASTSSTASYSRAEQARVETAGEGLRRELAEANREYEARFGHLFLTSAAGRVAEELLAELRRRLRNSPATELRIAASYQSAIARHRLSRLGAE